ncbi:MAG: hypothetical protein L3J02_05165, partial [Henriciella sp.]|nr:hypothetical protein [Henriciella sp.]
EQTLRENQLRAEVAEEMGIGPDASSEAVEAEVTRRLYEEERSALDDRASEARQSHADVIGPNIEAALGQIEADLISVQSLAESGDTQTALESVRTATTEMGRVDEMIRDQSELKLRYETEVADMGAHANRLATSEIESVSIAADNIINALPDVDALALAANFQGALDMVAAWVPELADLDLQNAQAVTQKLQVDTAMQAISSRISAVRSNIFPEMQAPADIILTKVTEIENLILSEAYTDAIGEIDGLKEELDVFESEAESADLYARYSSAMAVLDLENQLLEMRSCIFPETDESQSLTEAKETERLGHEQDSDWGAASTAAYAESEMIGQLGSEILAIEGAKTAYEAEYGALINHTETTLFPDAEDDTGTIRRYQSELSGIRVRMEDAASLNRFLEAVEIMAEFRTKIDEIVLAVPGLFQASDGRINGFIEGRVELAQGAVIGAIATAILRFENYIQDQVSNERGFQLAARQLGYEIDIVNAWLALIPEAGDAAAAILSHGKVAADAGAVELDNYEDGEDKRVAAELVAPLRAEALSVGSTWNSNVGQWFKANALDVYKEVGNLLHAVNGENVSAANRVILEAGVPAAGSRPVFEEHYYQSLERQFVRQRG